MLAHLSWTEFLPFYVTGNSYFLSAWRLPKTESLIQLSPLLFPKPGYSDPSFLFMHVSAKLQIDKDMCHRCSASLMAKVFIYYTCQLSQLAFCQIVQIYFSQYQNSIYLFSNIPHWVTAMLQRKRIVISAICLHNCIRYQTNVGSQANVFYLESTYIHLNFPGPLPLAEVIMPFCFILQKVC